MIRNRRDKRKGFLLNHFSNDVVSLEECKRRGEREKQGGERKKVMKMRDQYECLDIQTSRRERTSDLTFVKKATCFENLKKERK